MIVVGAEAADTLAAIHALVFDPPWSVDALTDLLNGPGAFAVMDPGAKGFILIRTAADEAEVLMLAVAPAARRRGLGRRLVLAGARRAAEQGGASLFLEVAVDNRAAVALYHGCGFEAAGRRTGYYARDPGPPVDALVLRKPLRPPA